MSARISVLSIWAIVLAGCAETVSPLDAATPTDAADGSTEVDAPFANAPGVACGPNRCRGQEICCSAACGVCAFADECVDHGCAGHERDAGR